MSQFIASQYQKEIFKWVIEGSGNGIINAVAGSGKTTTLVEVSKLLHGKRLFFAAFNKHIVDTLSNRLPNTAICKTIHAVGYSCLKVKFSGRPVAKNETKYRSYCKQAAKEMHEILIRKYDALVARWNPNDEDLPDEPPSSEAIQEQLEKLINLSRSTLTDVEDIHAMEELITHFSVDCHIELSKVQYVLTSILSDGEKDALESQVIDYTDMLWLPYKWKLKPGSYDWVLVDEAQDLNNAQLNLIRKMASDSTRMLFVGDPQQAIYGFSGADSDSFYKIKSATSATEFPLSICYRCPKKVIEIVQSIVTTIEVNPSNTDGEIKEIKEEEVLKFVQEKDWILSRSTAPLVSLCFKLLAKKIHAYVKGKEIGKSLNSIIVEVEKIDGFNFLNFDSFLQRYQETRIEKLSQKLNTEKQIMDFKDQIASILVCYESFASITIDVFKSELQKLFKDQDTAVALSTIHRVKGLEENRIFILNYDTLPLKWDRQKPWEAAQEQNLKYVALTRTKHSLFLVNSSKE